MLAGGRVDVRDYVEGFHQHEDDFLVGAPVAKDPVHAVAEAEVEGDDFVGGSHGEKRDLVAVAVIQNFAGEEWVGEVEEVENLMED